MRLRTPRPRRAANRGPLQRVHTPRRSGLRGRLHGLPRPARLALEWGGTALLAVALVLVARSWLVTPYRVPSAVMEPTLHCLRGESAPAARCRGDAADRVLVNRVVYRLGDPERGDVVALEASARAARQCGLGEGDVIVQRVVGLPGETVRLARGRLRVDGERLSEPYVAPALRGRESGTWRVPSGRYFVLGDNRVASCDSRRWGPVAASRLLGRVFARYWPPGRIGAAAALLARRGGPLSP